MPLSKTIDFCICVPPSRRSFRYKPWIMRVVAVSPDMGRSSVIAE
jgi:hypothetical protein